MARLIETSLWIDFTRAKTPPGRKLEIQRCILSPDACLCEPVAFEVLRHATARRPPNCSAPSATAVWLGMKVC